MKRSRTLGDRESQSQSSIRHGLHLWRVASQIARTSGPDTCKCDPINSSNDDNVLAHYLHREWKGVESLEPAVIRVAAVCAVSRDQFQRHVTVCICGCWSKSIAGTIWSSWVQQSTRRNGCKLSGSEEWWRQFYCLAVVQKEVWREMTDKQHTFILFGAHPWWIDHHRCVSGFLTKSFAIRGDALPTVSHESLSPMTNKFLRVLPEQSFCHHTCIISSQ